MDLAENFVPTCANCNGNHIASYRDCPINKAKSEMIKTQQQNKITPTRPQLINKISPPFLKNPTTPPKPTTPAPWGSKNIQPAQPTSHASDLNPLKDILDVLKLFDFSRLTTVIKDTVQK